MILPPWLCRSSAISLALLPVPIALEPIAALFDWPDDEMSEADFLPDILDRTGAALLLDIANVYANARNRGTDPLELLDDLDITPSYRPRPHWRIALLTGLNRCAYAVIPTAGWRLMLDSYLGGLALERLYLEGQIAYRLLVARPVARA